jgi:large subunit ribosomal protein L3
MRSLLTSFRRLPLGVRTLATEAAGPAAPAAESSTSAASAIAGKWSPFTQRTGVLAKKRGMTALWDADGRRWPVTVLQLEDVQVVRVSPPPANDPKQLHSLQIGACDIKPTKATAQQRGHFRSAGVSPKHKLKEFRVTPDAVLPVGTEIGAGHFVPGQYIDVTANR